MILLHFRAEIEDLERISVRFGRVFVILSSGSGGPTPLHLRPEALIACYVLLRIDAILPLLNKV